MRMATCHPDRKHWAKGLCAQCSNAAWMATHKEQRVAYDKVHKAAYRAAHKPEKTAYMRAYNAAHREDACAYRSARKDEIKAYYEAHKGEIAAYKKAYRAAHKDEIAAREKAYREAHKDKITADKKAYYEAHKEELVTSNRTPGGRAKQFLKNAPDCTSTREEIEAIYAASVDMTTGLPGKVGLVDNGLVLDHIHNGPAIGLIPGWLNRVCTKYLDGNLALVIEHLERRREAIGCTERSTAAAPRTTVLDAL